MPVHFTILILLRDFLESIVTQLILLRHIENDIVVVNKRVWTMRHDTRLSRVLHILIHMENHKGAATSESIAAMLQTNPVVVRRTMAGLREHGYVSSEKGHGGGWVLARPLSEITLLDIYRALGAPELFSIGLAGDNPNCVIEQAVNAALFDAMKEAENILLSRFGGIALSQLAQESISRWSRVSNHPSAMEQL